MLLAAGWYDRLWRSLFIVGAVAVLCGCGGGETSVVAVPPVNPVPVAPESCQLPALPSKPANVVNVQSFGALPDDGLDDTLAIQTAINSLQPGQWLVFPAGTYEHRTRLTVRTPGVVLWSEGATLRATNPDDMAVMLAADGASIYNFTLTAVTVSRLYAPWHARIAVYDETERGTPLRDNVVQGNRVVNGGEPGTATANSASTAGIYVEYADNFLVAGNEIKRSLADGIQVVRGARNGRVLFNTVRESGDDMIGLVSYIASGDWTLESAASEAANLERRRDRELVRNVVVAYNDVSGQYFGRGISVVGGADITISHNSISKTAEAAAILVAREASFLTWGVNNVLVEDNMLSQVQTLTPAYTPTGWDASGGVTGHGGVEIHAFVLEDELGYGNLAEALKVQNIRVNRTSIMDTLDAGVRVGVGTGESASYSATRQDGSVVTRTLTGGTTGRIDLSDIAMSGIGGAPLQILANTTNSDNVYCEGLTLNGLATTSPACGGSRPLVSGALRSCSR